MTQNNPQPSQTLAETRTPVADFLAHAWSVVFSPVLVPTYGIILVFTLSMLSMAPDRTKWILIATVFGLTAVLPSLAILLLMRFGDVQDVALTRRSDRLYPYLIMGAAMLACGYYLSTTGLPGWAWRFYAGGAIACGVNLLVNFKWKISAHGAGMGGLIAMLLTMNLEGVPHFNLWIWVMSAVLCGGLLGTARVWLGRHTCMQTICGEAVGFLSVLLLEVF